MIHLNDAPRKTKFVRLRFNTRQDFDIDDRKFRRSYCDCRIFIDRKILRYLHVSIELNCYNTYLLDFAKFWLWVDKPSFFSFSLKRRLPLEEELFKSCSPVESTLLNVIQGFFFDSRESTLLDVTQGLFPDNGICCL